MRNCACAFAYIRDSVLLRERVSRTPRLWRKRDKFDGFDEMMASTILPSARTTSRNRRLNLIPKVVWVSGSKNVSFLEVITIVSNAACDGIRRQLANGQTEDKAIGK